MTESEKARAYDEALKKAKNVQETSDSNVLVDWMEYIFPELAESKDEKIRKALIEMVHDTTGDELWIYYNVHKEDVLVWLEKQGEQKPTSDIRYEVKAGGSVSVNEKPFDYEKATITQKDFAPQQELKFKVGDYIVNDYCMGRVVEITNDAYLLDTGQGIPFSCQSTRLWDIIKDAKKGDVLHSIGFHNDCIFIFNGLDNDGYREVATGYCCIFVSADKIEFGIQGPDGIEIDTVKPATKIQRDLLFQKMSEAGYKWDADKKELKKLTQSVTKISDQDAWSKEDEIEIPFGAKDSELQEETYYIPKGFHAEIDDDKVVIKKGEKSAAWSEEDEEKLQDCIGAIWAADYYLYEDKQDMEAWLKSLKDRIGG